MRKLTGGVLLAIATLMVGACNDEPTPTEPTPPPTTVTENFTGTLAQNGTTTYQFSAGSAGVVSATLTELQPDETLLIGVALGTWNGTQCTLVVTNERAAKSSIVSGNATAAVNLCLRVYDVGNVVTPATYTVQLVHP